RGEANAVGAHRSSDVLEDLLTQIIEGEVEPAGGILLNTGRDTNPAWIGETLETGRDIHPVTKNIIALDNDIADVDPDAEFDAIVRSAGITLGHAALPSSGTTQRINDASELNQQPIAGCLDDTAPVFGDLRVD